MRLFRNVDVSDEAIIAYRIKMTIINPIKERLEKAEIVDGLLRIVDIYDLIDWEKYPATIEGKYQLLIDLNEGLNPIGVFVDYTGIAAKLGLDETGYYVYQMIDGFDYSAALVETTAHGDFLKTERLGYWFVPKCEVIEGPYFWNTLVQAKRALNDWCSKCECDYGEAATGTCWKEETL